jgi:hypothetical protein
VLHVEGETSPALTQATIDEAMNRAHKVACSSLNDRTYPFPYSPEEAVKTCTPKGRCKIGWISADTARKAWYVWLDIHTGEGRLRKWTDSQ